MVIILYYKKKNTKFVFTIPAKTGVILLILFARTLANLKLVSVNGGYFTYNLIM